MNEFIGMCNGCFQSLGNCRCQKFKQRAEEDIKQLILKLDRYDNEWGFLSKTDKGEYVKLKDVLNLFSSERVK